MLARCASAFGFLVASFCLAARLMRYPCLGTQIHAHRSCKPSLCVRYTAADVPPGRSRRQQSVKLHQVDAETVVTDFVGVSVSAEHHKCTQLYVRRPYGVGLLVAGYDVRCALN